MDSDTGRLMSKTLFSIESPPVPPGYDVTARIVRTAPIESVAPPAPPQIQQPKLKSSSELSVAVESPASVTPPPAFSPQRLAELPETLVSEKPKEPTEFPVSFQKGHSGNLEPVLDAPRPDFETAQTPEPEVNDGISVDPDSFDELETDDGDMEGDDRETDDKDRETEDDDSETDDLDDEEEDDLQPEARQFGVWPKKSMQEVRADVRNFGGEVPVDESGVLIASTQRYYRSTPKTEKTFAWAAPKIRYQPLYFEDAQLERYGQTKGLIKQPIISGFKFFRDAALLPFNAAKDCPGSCDGPLGFCRPGSPCNDAGCSSCQR